MKLAADLKAMLGIGGTDRVLVLDGANAVGHRVVERLIDAEYPAVRVGVKTMHDKQETAGVEFVPFVWDDVDTYKDAL